MKLIRKVFGNHSFRRNSSSRSSSFDSNHLRFSESDSEVELPYFTPKSSPIHINKKVMVFPRTLGDYEDKISDPIQMESQSLTFSEYSPLVSMDIATNIITETTNYGTSNIMTETTNYGSTDIITETKETNKSIFSDISESTGKCTVFETSCNIIALLTGSGMLSLPGVASKLGTTAIPLLLLLGSVYIYTLTLVASSVEFIKQKSKENTNIDYLTFGKYVFGENGSKLVASCLTIELLLAIVSFFINISINLTAISPKLHPIEGIIGSSIIAIILCTSNLKYAAYSSALGIIMTLLVVIALFISAIQLENSYTDNTIPTRTYHQLHITSLPLSLGL